MGDRVLKLNREELDWIRLRYPDNRYRHHQVALAVTLKFFQQTGYYPSSRYLPDYRLVQTIAEQLECPDCQLDSFDWSPNNRTFRRFRYLIREYLGFRSFTKQDSRDFIGWLKREILPNAPSPTKRDGYIEEYFTYHQIESPKPEQLKRYIGQAHSEFESALFQTIVQTLAAQSKTLFDTWLTPHDSTEIETTPCYFIHLKQSLYTITLNTIENAIAQIQQLNRIMLPDGLFKGYSRQLLLKYHQRVMVESPSDIRNHADTARYAMLAIFSYVQKQQWIDALIQSLIDTTKQIALKAQTKIKKDIISDVAKVEGKFDILCTLASIAGTHPDGVISQAIYPTVSQETLQTLAKELSRRGHWYEQTVKAKMYTLYVHHHRRLLMPILESLVLQASHANHQPLINAISAIVRHKNDKKKMIVLTDDIPISGVIEKGWESLVIQKDKGKIWVDRFHYELAVLETLRTQLDCKSIWVEGTYRYRNPDEDLPQDFYQNSTHYFSLLNLSPSADTFIDEIQQLMASALSQLNEELPHNKQVKILQKEEKSWIKITPAHAQSSPTNIELLKADVAAHWQSLSLLDLLKETAMRTQFMEYFHTICNREILETETIHKRLLLCLYGIGTNAGLKRMSSGNKDTTYHELRYIKRYFITSCRVRAAIAKVVNDTLALRDPAIWGDGNTTLACDSKKINIWDQNLMSQWHARYKGPGVMIYWHVDQKSLCVYSQLKTCTSSEVASMIQGVLHHQTDMDVQSATIDTHGQSLAGFGFSYLLHFDLLPRIKGIHKEKLSLPDKSCRQQYPNLELILSNVINWPCIRDNYQELVRYTAALKLGMVDSDIILKRFQATNYQHPVYKALMELGRAIKTIFLCRYLCSESLRIDINASQNIVERVNGFMEFIFYGKLGEISTNKKQDQELAILCLHLLQASLTYINTLLIQKVLSSPKWVNKLTKEDKRAITPLIHNHINPYGLFPLDMRTRMNIEGITAHMGEAA